MKVQGNQNADKGFDAYSLSPEFDYEFSHALGDIEELPKPSGKVFVVITKMYDSVNKNAAGEVVSWSWVDESKDLPGAPVDHASRYEARIWSEKER